MNRCGHAPQLGLRVGLVHRLGLSCGFGRERRLLVLLKVWAYVGFRFGPGLEFGLRSGCEVVLGFSSRV